MRARRGTIALNSLLRESSFPQNRERNTVLKKKEEKYGKCGLCNMQRSEETVSTVSSLFFPGKEGND